MRIALEAGDIAAAFVSSHVTSSTNLASEVSKIGEISGFPLPLFFLRARVFVKNINL
jgi:hypothetical protein